MEGFSGLFLLMILMIAGSSAFLFRNNKRVSVPIVAVLAVGLLYYGYANSQRGSAVEEAMRHAEDACATGNKLLLDESIVHAQSIFRQKLDSSQAFEADARLENRLRLLGCRR